MDEIYYKHYININNHNNVIGAWSDGPLGKYKVATEKDILINDKGGYQFRLIIDGKPTVENPSLFDYDMIPLYKWDGAQVLRRTEEEIQAERDAVPPLPLSLQEQIAALENALCEQDLATTEWQATIEEALCELDSSKEDLN